MEEPLPESLIKYDKDQRELHRRLEGQLKSYQERVEVRIKLEEERREAERAREEEKKR
jgi:hypothetical protein